MSVCVYYAKIVFVNSAKEHKINNDEIPKKK